MFEHQNLKRSTIAKNLGVGQENASSLDTLMIHFSMTEREVRRQIEYERNVLHIPIVSIKGYFLPKTRDEVKKCRRWFVSFTNSHIKTIEVFNEWLSNNPNQMEIDPDDIEGGDDSEIVPDEPEGDDEVIREPFIEAP